MENKVLAIVNGKEITENDVKANISRFPKERQSQFYNEEGRKQFLDQMISFELIYNEALKNGIEKDEQYLAQLELAKKELLTQASINKLLSEVSVSDSEVEDYYNENKDMFIAPVKVTAKHILVSSKEKADEIRAQIESGRTFEEAAHEYSSCPSKAEGGNLGSFSKGQMVPEFEEVAFNLQLGVVSEPVKTQFGFHLIKVEDKEESNSKSFDEVKAMIGNNILQEKQNFKFISTTDNLKKKYNITRIEIIEDQKSSQFLELIYVELKKETNRNKIEIVSKITINNNDTIEKYIWDKDVVNILKEKFNIKPEAIKFIK